VHGAAARDDARRKGMTTRRILIGATGLGLLGETAWAQQSEPPPPRSDELRSRGRPTGRVGAATRGAQGALSLDLVAPLHGVGLTRLDQPRLLFLLSGSGTWPVRLIISTQGQPRPLVEREMSSLGPPALGAIELRSLAVRLAPNQLYTWSVVVPFDPRAPSRDLIATALIQYRPADPALEQSLREAPPLQRHRLLAAAGYWYDAVAIAEQMRGRDNGVALAELLESEQLHLPAVGA
jgi:hypothetical protein